MKAMQTTRTGKAIAPVVDIFPHLAVGFHDDARIAEEMRLLKTLGFERVYFVLCNPGYPMFSNPALCLQLPDIEGLENHSFRSVVALGDPNFAYLHHCRAQGMEAFAIIKPYEGGGGATVPHGAKLCWDMPRETTIGGERFGFDALLAKRPDLRVKRRPDAGQDRLGRQSVERITVSFCAEAIESTVDFDGLTQLAPADGSAERWPVSLHLFTSRDNGGYRRYPHPLTVEEKVEARIIRDANGIALFDEPRRCRMFTLSGIGKGQDAGDAPYFAVVIECAGRLFTLPQSMISLHGADGEIPATVSASLRKGGNPVESAKPPQERIWGMEQHPGAERNQRDPQAAIHRLCQWGLEFEWYGSGFWGPGWSDSCVYGIARGKLSHMKGTPCEAYAEVREYWLQWVRKCVEMGFDGVDLRLQSHSGMVSDYMSYGFNEPLVDAYRQKHGVDIQRNPEQLDALKLMGVRGDFYTAFVRQAAEVLHQAGRKLQVHLRHCHEAPRLSSDFNELGFWAMPKVWLEDWRELIDLADEITLKDYHFNKYNPALSSQIKDYAAAQGKRVWVHCYISQGRELNHRYFQDIEADSRVGGVLLYEVAHAEKIEVNHGLIEQYGPVALHEPTADLLRSIMSDCGFPARDAQ